MSKWSDLSKQVGLGPKTVSFPTSEQVGRALDEDDFFMLLTWYRFLPSGQTEEQIEIINALCGAVAVARLKLDK